MTPNEASACEAILRSLPQWFGNQNAIRGYRVDIEKMETFVAIDGDAIVGFATMVLHNPRSAEVQVLGVAPDQRRRGIGRSILDHIDAELTQRGVELLQIKTLGPSETSAAYEETRAFYHAMDFVPLEELRLPTWDDLALIMVKRLAPHRDQSR